MGRRRIGRVWGRAGAGAGEEWGGGGAGQEWDGGRGGGGSGICYSSACLSFDFPGQTQAISVNRYKLFTRAITFSEVQYL